MHSGKFKHYLVVVGALVVAVSFWNMSPLLADTKTWDDPDDTSGSLDISMIAQGHRREFQQRLVTHTVTTFEEWDNATIADSSKAGIELFLNTDDDKTTERIVHVGVNPDESLYAWISRARKPFEVIEYARAYRVDGRSVTIAFPRRLAGGGSYKWAAFTWFSDPGTPDCPRNTDCMDQSPFLTHRRG